MVVNLNDDWETKRVLMLVKTYPSPSTKYQEVVCTAVLLIRENLLGYTL
jgi:hypothetical protein